ncbi:MAG: peptidoglycan DD-metalloendopeptidase family protein [Desulfocapsa sp.]|nr:peptidoglycan DD-metalloendopeptidase family protein [Desulfocapsa sp.]
MSHLTAITQLKKFLVQSMGLILACSILLLNSSVGLAEDDRKIEKLRIEEGIDKYRININKLQDGISQKQDQIESSQKQERNLLEELAQIDHKLQEQKNKLDDLEKKMVLQQELITLKEVALEKLLKSKQTVQKHLQRRMKSYYKMGTIGIANVTFSTESIPLMLNFRDSFTSLINYDKQTLEEYRQSIAELQQSKDALAREKAVLGDFINQAREKQDGINRTKLEKEAFLTQTKTQKELLNRAIKEMEQATDSLVASLETLEKENKLFDQGFLLNKGKHPSPVHGKVIALFGQPRQNQLGIAGNNMGITILAPGMNRVAAIFDGEIRYASYLRGYGNTIIIDHGHKYFSVISRLEKLLKKKGDKVEQGDLIGLTGDTATLMGEGVYFEIRHDSTPQDPLDWLDKTGLILP